jgi:hypothetical protein
MSTAPEERIAEAFNAYFANFDIRIGPKDVAVGIHRTIGERLAYHLPRRPGRRRPAQPRVLRDTPDDQRPSRAHLGR